MRNKKTDRIMVVMRVLPLHIQRRWLVGEIVVHGLSRDEAKVHADLYRSKFRRGFSISIV